MHVIPVLDVLDSVVVRGVAGQRNDYRPVQSLLTDDPAPLAVARAFREHFGLSRLYVADLDAILHERAHVDLYRQLAAEGFALLVDAGVRSAQETQHVLSAEGAVAVVALETSPTPKLLRELCDTFPPARLAFSLDLKDGRPMGDLSAWNTDDPYEIALQVVELGIERMIVLDLAAVGTGGGLVTGELCRKLKAVRADLEIITGGGVRGPGDLGEIAGFGVDGVLVASALHDGRIGRKDVA